jgi:predicted DNA-binding protein (UPF0251 family)
MPRPFCRRRVGWRPGISTFLPVSSNCLHPEPEIIALNLDELEALRLADLECLYQEQAAEKMGVSRPTFARILESARKKVAEALVKGKGLVIGGGPVEVEPESKPKPKPELQPESEPEKFHPRQTTESTEQFAPDEPCPPFPRGSGHRRGPYGCPHNRRGNRYIK